MVQGNVHETEPRWGKGDWLGFSFHTVQCKQGMKKGEGARGEILRPEHGVIARGKLQTRFWLVGLKYSVQSANRANSNVTDSFRGM